MYRNLVYFVTIYSHNIYLYIQIKLHDSLIFNIFLVFILDEYGMNKQPMKSV